MLAKSTLKLCITWGQVFFWLLLGYSSGLLPTTYTFYLDQEKITLIRYVPYGCFFVSSNWSSHGFQILQRSLHILGSLYRMLQLVLSLEKVVPQLLISSHSLAHVFSCHVIMNFFLGRLIGLSWYLDQLMK